MILKYFYLILLFFVTGCKLVCDEPNLVTSRQDFLSNAIRIDGIYHNKKYNSFFLYTNGVYQSGCFDRNITAIPDRFDCSKNLSNGDRSDWRIFIVTNNTIYLEGWGLVADCDYDVFSYTGKILNDTTLIIPTDRAGLNKDTFYFAKFLPKPDSTNNFIK